MRIVLRNAAEAAGVTVASWFPANIQTEAHALLWIDAQETTTVLNMRFIHVRLPGQTAGRRRPVGSICRSMGQWVGGLSDFQSVCQV